MIIWERKRLWESHSGQEIADNTDMELIAADRIDHYVEMDFENASTDVLVIGDWEFPKICFIWSPLYTSCGSSVTPKRRISA